MSDPQQPFPVPPEGAPIPGRPSPQSHLPVEGAPALPPPPFQEVQARASSRVLIGIIAALVIVITIGATLFFTGVIGGGGRSASGGNRPAAGASLPLTRDSLVGSWSTEGDCSKHVSELTAAGEFWQNNLATSGGAPVRMGSWRLAGNRLTTSTELSSGSPLDTDYIVASVSSDAIVATYRGEEQTWPRCQAPLASGASTAR